jgi:hypothetical protein
VSCATGARVSPLGAKWPPSRVSSSIEEKTYGYFNNIGVRNFILNGAPFCRSSADSQIQREDSPFRYDAAGVLLHAPRPAQAGLCAAFISRRAINVALVLRMRGEDPRRKNRQKPGPALAVLCLNQLVNRRGDARNPLGSKSSLQIPDAEKLLLISLGACPDARTLTMRERALTKDGYLMSV